MKTQCAVCKNGTLSFTRNAKQCTCNNCKTKFLINWHNGKFIIRKANKYNKRR